MATSTQDAQSRQMEAAKNGRGLWTTAVIAGVVAGVINLIIYFLATGVLNIPVEITMGGPTAPLVPLTPGPVIVMSLIPAIGAAVLLWILRRFTARPYTIFLIIAVIALLLSFGGPLPLPIAAAAKGVLILMHVVTAAVIVGWLGRFAR